MVNSPLQALHSAAGEPGWGSALELIGWLGSRLRRGARWLSSWDRCRLRSAQLLLPRAQVMPLAARRLLGGHSCSWRKPGRARAHAAWDQRGGANVGSLA